MRCGPAYREYWGGRQCAGCPLRSRCTDSPRGRKLKRYAGEEFREWMAALLEHPLARARYRRRKAIVEPCFAELRERQGLKRFHRRGLTAVRVEFALHCMAFNLKRAVGLFCRTCSHDVISHGAVRRLFPPPHLCRCLKHALPHPYIDSLALWSAGKWAAKSGREGRINS